MTGHLAPSEIEMKWRTTGTGICVIVEGETELDDQWYFEQWFGGQARNFTFFAQNGWEKVVNAVEFLRPKLGDKKVYGIRDRDFDSLPSVGTISPEGLGFTQKYTLENYLLDPEIWFQVLRPFISRNPRPGWNSIDDARQTIQELYRQCLPLSAFNWTVRLARQCNNSGFGVLPDADKTYKRHPNDLPANIPAHFARLRQDLNLQSDLSAEYTQRLAWLQAAALDTWEQVVSGKYVLKLLKPKLRGNWEDLIGSYMFHSATPPADLADLLETFYQNSQTP